MGKPDFARTVPSAKQVVPRSRIATDGRGTRRALKHSVNHVVLSLA
ncbi:hypothetical protein DHODJN_23345 [Methylorubrum extorquens]